MIVTAINLTSDILWEFFLPLLILLGLFINIKMIKNHASLSKPDYTPWQFNKIKGALSISLASKVGTGAIIGVLAAMWKSSTDGGANTGGVLFFGLLLVFFFGAYYLFRSVIYVNL
ncbi:hypothetical protein [Psychromonas hadalis]|uniref:hypothetical protein n=1 Tax=Psychromonas hadalis TaxID=211669 RepID=UPI0004147319|nr:hypothetical protein [Psychromonas hadalis]